jgi:hypothetical protein
MKEPEMEQIAAFIAECLIQGKRVGDEVRRFRAKFQTVHYSFDDKTGGKSVS